ncbi:hypothetical protein KHS38_18790 [Mucilaginibacter sp. Bleaf8]|uniref:hypothetical protein n=1 Tax=Mucilaginibacter sp. Bleaf8 TaxID=2834430 RepID=UPI001BCA725B|nr:hypothetical protein [Mucilaginibacter sp. Bleaf8]MBS7566459.1 hypothetical protein [Mucilaginibacter sp. Bleaf8]
MFKSTDPTYYPKLGIWVFFYLLIFEGALRRWVLPGLATPLLLVRDPVAIWIIYKAWEKKLIPVNGYIVSMVIVGVVSMFTAVFFGHGNLFVALYGSRIWLLYFPLMYVIGVIFTREDVLLFAKRYMWLSIPMTVLITLQFYSPQSAWVNRGVGGNTEGAGFSGAMGFFRPPGTFSFASGVGSFYSALASFVFYYCLDTKNVNKKLLIASIISLLIAVPISIIRGLFFQVGVTLVFMLLAALRKPKLMAKVVPALIAGFMLIILLSQLPFFQTATEAFTERFTVANESEGGVEGVVGDRYLGGMIAAFTKAAEQPFWGYGSGMGTNVGGTLLTGKQSFYGVINGEIEWQRVVGELGLLMGVVVIFIRTVICVQFFVDSYNKLNVNDFLPWMILPFCLTNIPQGTWGIPTPLGFDILIGGVMLASFNIRKRVVTKVVYA